MLGSRCWVLDAGFWGMCHLPFAICHLPFGISNGR
jgi:hypothetical protein